MAKLTIVCGLPGVGKTTVAKDLSVKTGSVLLRTDVIRKEANILGYSEEEKQLVYDEMLSIAEKLLKGDKNVILDATFNKEKNRQAAQNIAGIDKADFEIVEVICPEEIVKERMEKRSGDESEAKFEDYLKHKKFFEPIKEKHTIIDSSMASH